MTEKCKRVNFMLHTTQTVRSNKCLVLSQSITGSRIVTGLLLLGLNEMC